LIERDFELVPQGLLTLLAVLPTVLLFGLLHGNLVGGVLIGALLAWATTWRGRLADAVQLHVAINGALLLAGLALDRPDLWLGPGR
jgi:membrane protease YdiL (CAAX protease family)